MSGMVRRAVEVEWVDLMGHKDAALTKLLVTRETCGARNLDFFISSYAPKAHAEVHAHERSEEVFYFLAGEGLFLLDGERHVVEPGTVIFVPPGSRHGIFNTGFTHLVFVVTASPPEEAFHAHYREYFAASEADHEAPRS